MHSLLLAALLASGRSVLLLECCTKELPEIRYVDAESCATVVYNATVPWCRYPGAKATSDAVNAFVEMKIRESVGYEQGIEDARAAKPPDEASCEDAPWHGEAYSASCESPHVAGSLLSFRCGTWFEGARGEMSPWSINLEITAAGLREVSLDHLFVDESAASRFWNLVKDDLTRQLREHCGDQWSDDPDLRTQQLDAAATQYDSAIFTADGIAVGFSRFDYGFCIAECTIPYERLDGILKSEFLPVVSIPK